MFNWQHNLNNIDFFGIFIRATNIAKRINGAKDFAILTSDHFKANDWQFPVYGTFAISLLIFLLVKLITLSDCFLPINHVVWKTFIEIDSQITLKTKFHFFCLSFKFFVFHLHSSRFIKIFFFPFRSHSSYSFWSSFDSFKCYLNDQSDGTNMTRKQ